MLAEKYYRYKQCYDQDGVIFSFCGFISEGVLCALGDVLKKQLALKTADPNRARQVFSVFIELVQNIIRYSVECFNGSGEGTDRLGSGIIIVGSRGDQFYVGCGNTVAGNDAARLQEKLELLQELDQKELRSYYRQKLKEQPESSGCLGASLGLIEIARRSSAPLEFDFLKIDLSKTFYYIKSYI